MQYGIYLANVGETSDPLLLAELAHEAEEEGWDGVFIWDHIGGPQTARTRGWRSLRWRAHETGQARPVITPVARRRPWKLARRRSRSTIFPAGVDPRGRPGMGAEEFDSFGEDGDPRTRAKSLTRGSRVGRPLEWRALQLQRQALPDQGRLFPAATGAVAAHPHLALRYMVEQEGPFRVQRNGTASSPSSTQA